MIKKLRSTALSTPKLKKKGNGRKAVWSQLTSPWSRSVGFFVPCGYSASGWKSPRGVKTIVPEPIHWELAHIISPGLRGRSCFACGKFGHFRSHCPVPLNYQLQQISLTSVCGPSGPSQSLQNRDKSWNYFLEHYNLDSYEYEQGVSSNIVVPGSLKNHIQLWRSIGTSQFL